MAENPRMPETQPSEIGVSDLSTRVPKEGRQSGDRNDISKRAKGAPGKGDISVHMPKRGRK